MYVCICKGVSEQDIRDATARGAHSLKGLRRELGVASECGQCVEDAKRCLKKALEDLGHAHHHRHHRTKC